MALEIRFLRAFSVVRPRCGGCENALIPVSRHFASQASMEPWMRQKRKCEGGNNKLQEKLPATRARVTPCWHRALLAPEAACTLLEHPDMDKISRMAVDG